MSARQVCLKVGRAGGVRLSDFYLRVDDRLVRVTLATLDRSRSIIRRLQVHDPTLSGSKGVSAGVALRQRLQQRLGLLEVSSIKTLSEPTVNFGEHCARFPATIGLAGPTPVS